MLTKKYALFLKSYDSLFIFLIFRFLGVLPNWKCLILCHKLFASVMDTACAVMDKRMFFYQVCNMKLKPTFGLKNTGKHWQLVYVRTSNIENSDSWLVLQQ